jgi:hypothetical protein
MGIRRVSDFRVVLCASKGASGNVGCCEGEGSTSIISSSSCATLASAAGISLSSACARRGAFLDVLRLFLRGLDACADVLG